MTDIRVTQGAAQVLHSTATVVGPDIRVTQGAIQVLHNDTTAPTPPYSEDSGSVRVTQSAMLALGEFTADARITQSAMLVMTEVTADARITQSPWLVLAEFDADIRITQSAILVVADQVPCVTKWTKCWKITRVDGQVFAFTSLDRNLTFLGITYKSCSSLSGTATQSSSAQGSVGNQDITGLISDDSITETDLYGGVFDGATIELWLVPWENAGGETPRRLLAGKLGNVEQGLVSFQAEIVSPGSDMQQRPLLDTFTPGCRFKLGDERCKVDLDALEVSGTVTGLAIPTGPNSATRRIFTDSSRSEATGYFDFGELTWTSGNNIGLSSEIKSFDGSTFVLWDPMISSIEIGDTYDVKPGCDLSEDDCKNKFDNFDNNGAFPDVPGEDQIFQTPDTH